MGDGDRRRRGQALADACAPASAPLPRGRTSARLRARCGRPRCRASAPRRGSRSSARSETATAARRNSPRARRRCRPPRAPRAAPHPRSSRPARRSRRGTTTCSARNGRERPSRQRSPSIASMITTGSVRGKCCGLAGRAIAPPAGLRPVCVGAPQLGQKRWRACQPSSALAFGERRQMLGATRPLHRDRAQVGDVQVVARLERLDRRRIERDARSGRAVDQAEEHGLARACRARAPRPSVNSGSSAAPVFLQHHHFAADHIGARAARRSRARQCAAASARRSAARSMRLPA